MAVAVAKKIATGIHVQSIDEKAEPNEFWQALNGKGDYDQDVDAPGAPLLEPRLFHCHLLSNGKIKLEEIADFEQSDLDDEDVMLVDAGDEVYVWEGKHISDEEKRRTIDVAQVRYSFDTT